MSKPLSAKSYWAALIGSIFLQALGIAFFEASIREHASDFIQNTFMVSTVVLVLVWLFMLLRRGPSLVAAIAFALEAALGYAVSFYVFHRGEYSDVKTFADILATLQSFAMASLIVAGLYIVPLLLMLGWLLWRQTKEPLTARS